MIWFGWGYSISTIVGYSMPNILCTYILHIYDLVWLGLWHINHFRSFNSKSSFYIYIKYIGFDLVWICGKSTIVGYLMRNPLFHIYYIYMTWFGWVFGISTIVGFLMSNPLYTYILNTYDLVGLGFMAYQPL